MRFVVLIATLCVVSGAQISTQCQELIQKNGYSDSLCNACYTDGSDCCPSTVAVNSGYSTFSCSSDTSNKKFIPCVRYDENGCSLNKLYQTITWAVPVAIGGTLCLVGSVICCVEWRRKRRFQQKEVPVGARAKYVL